MGAPLGLWVALTLSLPASLRPINLNLPPPAPPAQSPSKPNMPWTPPPPASWRPGWLPPWLIPDQISVPTRKGKCGAWGYDHRACRAGHDRR